MTTDSFDSADTPDRAIFSARVLKVVLKKAQLALRGSPSGLSLPQVARALIARIAEDGVVPFDLRTVPTLEPVAMNSEYVTFSVRVIKDVRAKAAVHLSSNPSSLTLSQVVRSLIGRIAQDGAVPFDLRTPAQAFSVEPPVRTASARLTAEAS